MFKFELCDDVVRVRPEGWATGFQLSSSFLPFNTKFKIENKRKTQFLLTTCLVIKIKRYNYL